MFERSIKLIKDAVEQSKIPCAAIALGQGNELFAKKVFGYRQVNPTPIEADKNTLFDIASLSKLIGTTMVALKFIEEGKLALYDELSMFFKVCYDKSSITIKDLMTHTSGLKAHIPLYSITTNKDDAVSVILKSDFDYKTGTKVVYSCMGYILLGKILEIIGEDSLDELVKKYVFAPLRMISACYNPTVENVVTTEYRENIKAYTKGTVHDENAAFLNGIAGNAGIFAGIDDMIKFASMISSEGNFENEQYLTSRTFVKAICNYTAELKGESRGLGFQLKGINYSPCGDLFGSKSYGHTGFTGTSLYVDEQSGFYAILLTNAVHFGRDKTDLIRLRRLFYNCTISEFLKLN